MTPRIGVSQCLLGVEVRRDGGHKHFPYVTNELSKWAELVAVCPEAELGLGTPREPIRLEVAAHGEVRLVAAASGTDHTGAMASYAAERVRSLTALGLSGFVLKSGSPSCGLEAPVHGRSAAAAGMFAEALGAALPGLPLVDETGLGTRKAQAAFAARVRAYHPAKLQGDPISR